MTAIYIPNIEVHISDFNYNVKAITDLLHDSFLSKSTSLSFYDRVIKALPELRETKVYGENYSTIFKNVEKILEIHYIDNIQNLEESKTRLNELLNKFLPPVIREMLELFHVNWPREQETIKCNIGLYPVFPRDVISKEYWIHYKATEEIIKKASVHEINHFILFEKWKSMHGYSGTEQPVHPQVLWFLEEMSVDPTLNDPKMQSVSPYEQKAYPKFYENSIKGIRIQDYINQFYKDSACIEEFLDQSFQFIQSNHNSIIKHCG